MMMMVSLKIGVFLTLAVVFVASAEDVIPIVSQESDVQPDGHYHYSYETGNGIRAQQDGELKVFDKDAVGQVAHGGFEYKGDDGHVYSVSYTADENGYQPQGEHLPKAHPVPEAIARALEYIASAPPSKENAE